MLEPINPYKEFLDTFFATINEYSHFSNRVSKILKLDAEKYTSEGARYTSSTALILADWTGPTDKGWVKNFHSGVLKITTKEDYAREIEEVTSIILSSYYVQYFESLELFMKKTINFYCTVDPGFKEFTKTKYKMQNSYSIAKIKGGDTLYNLIEHLCSPLIHEYSASNNNNIRFKTLFKVLSKSRNSIVHTGNTMPKSTFFSNKSNKAHFIYLFDYQNIGSNRIKILITQNKFKKIVNVYAEFAFQIYKMVSIKQNLSLIFTIDYATEK